MNEIVYHNEDGVLVSNLQFRDGKINVDPHAIEDFDLLSTSISSSVQLQIISPLGSRPAWNPVTTNNRIDTLKLRSLILALARAIADREKERQTVLCLDTNLAKFLNPPSGTKLTITDLPPVMETLESTVAWLMREPGEPFEATNRRFAEAVTPSTEGNAFRDQCFNIATKIIYEYERKYGHRVLRSKLFRTSPEITLGRVFRPIDSLEMEAFVSYCTRLMQDGE